MIDKKTEAELKALVMDGKLIETHVQDKIDPDVTIYLDGAWIDYDDPIYEQIRALEYAGIIEFVPVSEFRTVAQWKGRSDWNKKLEQAVLEYQNRRSDVMMEVLGENKEQAIE